MPRAEVRAALAAGGIGYLSDRIGYKSILLFNLALTAVSILLHGVAQSIAQLALLRFLYGLAAGGILPAMNALVGRLVPPESYGKAYGLTASMTCLGMTAGPFLGGIMASWWGYRWPFVLVGAYGNPDHRAHPLRRPHASPLTHVLFTGLP